MARGKSAKGQTTIYKTIKGIQQTNIYNITHDLINE
jgi:hypothetical protein